MRSGRFSENVSPIRTNKEQMQWRERTKGTSLYFVHDCSSYRSPSHRREGPLWLSGDLAYVPRMLFLHRILVVRTRIQALFGQLVCSVAPQCFDRWL